MTPTKVRHTMDTVYYVEHWVWKGQDMMTRVYRQARGCYTAETGLDILDKVVTDGRSEDEALRTPLRALTLAILVHGALY